MNDTQQRVRNRLIGEHSLSEHGCWHVRGEDPNCDFGGPHIQPNLGYFIGKYGDVMEHALQMKGFIGWGYGGSIEKIEATVLDDDYKNKQQRIQQINEQIKNLEQEKTNLSKRN